MAASYELECSITWGVMEPRLQGPTTKIGGPKPIMSQLIPFYTNLRPQSGLRGCEAASRAVQKHYGPPSKGRNASLEIHYGPASTR